MDSQWFAVEEAIPTSRVESTYAKYTIESHIVHNTLTIAKGPRESLSARCLWSCNAEWI